MENSPIDTTPKDSNDETPLDFEILDLLEHLKERIQNLM